MTDRLPNPIVVIADDPDSVQVRLIPNDGRGVLIVPPGVHVVFPDVYWQTDPLEVDLITPGGEKSSRIERRAQVEALREAADACPWDRKGPERGMHVQKWLRARADQIEQL